MRRIALTTTLAALALPVTAQAAGSSAAPALGVRVAACQVGAVVEQRGATFEATMPAVDGASALAMRFEIEQRRGGGAWKAVAGVPGFGRYERSAPDAAGFVYDKRVERLAAGSAYRVVVRFRWTAASGAVLKRATRRSAACRQPDLRPDLAVAAVTTGEALPGGRARYVVRVRNGGLSAVLGTLRVGLAVDGVALPALALSGLGAGQTGEVAFEGPACGPQGSVTATADPDDGLEEKRETDNALAVACP